jgi:hypothetical protein
MWYSRSLFGPFFFQKTWVLQNTVLLFHSKYCFAALPASFYGMNKFNDCSVLTFLSTNLLTYGHLTFRRAHVNGEQILRLGDLGC